MPVILPCAANSRREQQIGYNPDYFSPPVAMTLPAVAAEQLIAIDELLNAFADFLHFFHIDVGAGDASGDTLNAYRRQIAQFVAWCTSHNVEPGRARPIDIKHYRRWLIEERRLKPATVALKLSVVRRFYQAALERGSIASNPAVGIKPPRERRDPADRITFLEKSEVEQLLSVIPRGAELKALRDRLLLAIMVLEGPRTVELHRANISDAIAQGSNYGIRVSGKRNVRIVPLTPQLAQLLLDYLDRRQANGDALHPSDPLFIAIGNRAGGQRLSRRGIRAIVDGYLVQANLKHAAGRTISAHSLRHTAGTLALRAGADLRQVQDLLGHADPRTTCIYAHIADRWANNPALKLGIQI